MVVTLGFGWGCIEVRKWRDGRTMINIIDADIQTKSCAPLGGGLLKLLVRLIFYLDVLLCWWWVSVGCVVVLVVGECGGVGWSNVGKDLRKPHPHILIGICSVKS